MSRCKIVWKMSNCGTYQTQIASIMDVLAKAAVAEISKVVEDAVVVLRLETCQRQDEIEALKRNLEVVSNELRATRRALVRECINGRSVDFQVRDQPVISRDCGRKGVRVEESRCVEEECHSKGPSEEDKNASFRVTVKVEREDERENQGTRDSTAGGAMGNSKLVVGGEELSHIWPTDEDDSNNDDSNMRAMGGPSPPQTRTDALLVSVSTATSTAAPPAPHQRPRVRRWWPHKMLPFPHLNTPANAHSHTHPPPPAPGMPRGLLSGPGVRGFLWGHYRSRGTQRSQRSSQQQPWARGKRRFPCGYCEKSFDRLSHLDRHRRIHTGERPYGCSVCGRRFTQKSSLKGHLRTHRGFSVDVSDSTPALERRLSEEDWDSQYSTAAENDTHLPTQSEDNTDATLTGDSHMLFTHGHDRDRDAHLTEAARVETHKHLQQPPPHGMPPLIGGPVERPRGTAEMQLAHTQDGHLAPPDALNVNDLLNQEANLHRCAHTHTQHLTHIQDPNTTTPTSALTHSQDSASGLTHTREPVGFGELQLELKAEQEKEEEEEEEEDEVVVDQSLHQGAEECAYGTGDLGQMEESGVSELEFGAVEESDPQLWANRGEESYCANSNGPEAAVSMQLGLPSAPPTWPHPGSPAHIKQEEEACPLSDPLLDSLAFPEASVAARAAAQQDVTSSLHAHAFIVRAAGDLKGSPTHQSDVTAREAPPSSSLANNQASPPRDKRRFPCAHCGKSFDRLSHLDRHQRIHTGERPYGCPLCGRRFTQKSSLKGHQRTHTGERPYRCPSCSLAFATSSARNRHQCAPPGNRLAYAW